MSGKFFSSAQVEIEKLDWGTLKWLSTPRVTQAKQLVVVEVEFRPGTGHSFHKHPNQEEVLYVLEGEVEQWIDRDKQVLRAGDAAYIPADVVHGSFNRSQENVRILAILGPCIGEAGYELVDVAGESPWNTLATD